VGTVGVVASTATVLLRGFTKRCGRCGARRIFNGWFRLKDRCPVCGYRFVREPGAFTGAMLVNFTFTLGAMISPLLLYVLWRGVSGDERLAFAPFAVACVVLAVVVPLLCYPSSASGWAAMDLVMRPLDTEEVLDAEASRPDSSATSET
jgi:uncharacterized protein (DUF983 family)